MAFAYLYLTLIAIMITIPSLGNILYAVSPSLRTSNFGVKAEQYYFYFVMGVIINTPTIIFGTYITF